MKKIIFILSICFFAFTLSHAQSPALKADVQWNVDMSDHEAVLAELQKMIRDPQSQFNGGDKVFFGKVMEFILEVNPQSTYSRLDLVKGAFLSQNLMVEHIDGSLLTNTVYDKTTNSYIVSPLGKKGPVLCLTLEENGFKYVLCKLESLKDLNRPCFNPNLLKQTAPVISAMQLDNSPAQALNNARAERANARKEDDCNDLLNWTVLNSRQVGDSLFVTYKTPCVGRIIVEGSYNPLQRGNNLGLTKNDDHKKRRYLGWKIGVPLGLVALGGGLYILNRAKHHPNDDEEGKAQEIKIPIGGAWEEVEEIGGIKLPPMQQSNQFTLGITIPIK